MIDINTDPRGIGGWLILPMLGLIIAPIQMGALLAMVYMPIFLDGSWEILTTPGSEAYHHLWAPILVFEILCNVCLLVFSVILLVMFFRKHCKLPCLIIVFYVLNLAFVGIDFFVSDLIPSVAEESDPKSVKELIKAITNAAIWIPYFLQSRRVQNTFINGKAEQNI